MINQHSDSPFKDTGANIYNLYHQAGVRGLMFHGCSTVAVATQAGMSATTPCLTLYNPVGSGVNLVLINVSVMFDVQPTLPCGIFLASNAVAAGAPTTVTLATVKNSVLGSTKAAIGQCYRVATLGASPLAIRPLGSIATTAANGNATPGVLCSNEINGQIVIDPGVGVSIQTSSAASIYASFTWLECSL